MIAILDSDFQAVLADADASRFVFTETVTGSVRNRNPKRIGKLGAFLQQTSAGFDREALTLIGAWRSSDQVGDATSPVAVPMLYVDIDREDLDVAYDDARTLLFRLEDEYGFDLRRVFVSFSGNRGFHVAIAASQIGNPVYANANVAREIIGAFLTEIAGPVEIDTCTFTPLALIRSTGAVHPKSERQKTTWRGDYFFALDDEVRAAFDGSYRPFTYPNPLDGPVEPPVDVFDHFAREAVETYLSAQKIVETQDIRAYSRPPASLREIIDNGVSEGQRFARTHSGRSKAAFMIACWLLETNDGDLLGALDYLTEWNRRNNPPLSEHGLVKPLNSAARTLYGKGKLSDYDQI